MKILQVTNFFKPSWEAGGTARSVYEISNNLTKKGHDVTVYTTDGFKYRLDVPKNESVLVDGIKTYYFKNLSNYLSKKMVIPIPYYLPIIAKKEIKEFDIIHIHEHRTILATIVVNYARKYNIPYIIQPRGSIPIFAKGKQKKIFDVLLGKAIINDATKIIASSKIESDQYKSVFPELNENKVVHIPNGIDVETYRTLPKKGTFKKKYSIEANKKIILFLSRIHERKGADILIEAFNCLKNETEDLKLVIAGPDDGFLSRLKEIVHKLDLVNDVLFPGPLYEINKFEAYVDADVFVLPSKDKYESFGNVIIEACACGVPVIVTENCGVSEYVSTDLGYVITPVSEHLYMALSDLFKSDNRILSKKRSQLIRDLSWNTLIERYEQVYADCLPTSSN